MSHAKLKASQVHLELPLELQGAENDRGGGLRNTLAHTRQLYRSVLKGIDFTLQDGDRLGILGLNGAGKTTLLRVLNGALPPTAGRVERMGSTQSMLNPMLGFHENASLVENVLLRGTAMGLRYRQVQAHMDDILAFAGLESAANHRLHTLSAGQRMRLGFAISTAVQPDILLMDEWLSAGDAAFLERAQERMTNRFANSRVVVMASHSTALLRSTCNLALVLKDGRLHYFGPVDEGMEAYRGIVSRTSAQMRAELAESDPLLFGDAAGVVERIRTAGPLLEIQGWGVTNKGEEVGAICVELDGHTHLIQQFDRVDREDVRLHLGKSRGSFGFRVVVKTGPLSATDNLPCRLTVSVGPDLAQGGTSLPIVRGAIIEVATE